MNELVTQLVELGRTLVIAITGPPASGKTHLAHLLHRNHAYNRRYYYDPCPQLISSVYRIQGVSYVLQTIEHACCPCNVCLCTGVSHSKSFKDVPHFLVQTRVDVDAFAPGFDYYSSFVDGYCSDLETYQQVQSVKREFADDWCLAYRKYGMRAVQNASARDFLAQRYGVDAFLYAMLTRRGAFSYRAGKEYCEALVLEIKNARPCFYEIFPGNGLLLVKYTTIRLNHGDFLGLADISTFDIKSRCSDSDLPYIMVFDAKTAASNRIYPMLAFASRIVPLHFRELGARWIVQTSSVRDAEYILSLLPQRLPFRALTQVYLTIDGRVPVFEFIHRVSASMPARTREVHLKFVIERCEQICEFDRAFLVYDRAELRVGNFVLRQGITELAQSEPVANAMLTKFAYHLSGLHEFRYMLIRLVEFAITGERGNPQVLESALCCDSFYSNLVEEFRIFIKKYLHVIEPVQVYKLYLARQPSTATITKFCAQRRAKSEKIGEQLILAVPVVEEPGIEDQMQHFFQEYQIDGSQIKWYFLPSRHAGIFEAMDYSTCIEYNPELPDLAEYLVHKAFLENQLFADWIPATDFTKDRF